MDVFSVPYFSLFVIIAIGFIIGRVKISGISLDISAVIFVALLFGHYGIIIPSDFQDVGLVLFLFTIGLQAGPGFFQTFRSNGVTLVIVAAILVTVAAGTTIFTAWIMGIDQRIAVGLFAGAITSTAGLAAAIDSTGSSLPSIGYGIAYPFGVIGVIFIVRLLPGILSVKITDAEREMEQRFFEIYPRIQNRQFVVENENITGKSIKSLNIRNMTGASISRVLSGGKAITPFPDTVLQRGDLVKAVGSNEALEKVRVLIGNPTDQDIPLGDDFEIESILVTNKEIVNKTIGELNLFSNYNATVTRIRRSGIDIIPTLDSHVRFGDKLLVASDKENIKAIMKVLGNQEKKLSDTDMLPIAAGIVLGILAGRISIGIGENIIFNLGLAGGVLLVSLILGNIGKTGPLIWSMSASANQLLRQLGLLFFLAAVGTRAGAQLVESYTNHGMQLIYAGIIITAFPMLLSAFLARYLFRINLLSIMGTLTGGMTSTPGLAAIEPMTGSNAPQIAYAAVYPVAMVLIIIFTQIISRL
jgi:putative transport protein